MLALTEHTIWKEWAHFPMTVKVALVRVNTKVPLDKMQHTERAFIAWIFAGRTRPVKLHAADTTDIVLWHVPAP